jgi:protease IV
VNALVQESYDWFKGMVKMRRGMDEVQLAVVTDGRVFSGRQAVGLRLIDEVGGEREALAWLEREKGVAKDLPIREWRRRTSFEEFGLSGSLAGLARSLGLARFTDTMERVGGQAEALSLDGLLAVWQPALEN